jgi:FAD dependent oxidoreductase TIGR03364
MDPLRTDVAVVGGGIVGLAHAWSAARRGLSVALFERDRLAQGASVRNFGMVWPIGQPSGEPLELALRSRRDWLELGRRAEIWVNPCGSLHLAYRPDELAVLEEFAPWAPTLGYDARLLSPAEILRRAPAVNPDGLLGALWSPVELCVDPRQAIARLPHWLHETHGVRLEFRTAVVAVEAPRLHSGDGQTWHAKRILVCSGIDFQTLFPAVFAAAGLRRCKLQMMRTAAQPDGWRLGPHLAGGLTLCHYAAFRRCSSLAALRRRVEEEMPAYVRYGIHVMASQNQLGQVVLGDSHEYDEAATSFDSAEIEALILEYLRGMVRLPDASVAARWNGVYAKHPTLPFVEAEPQPGVTVIAALGGAGMTLSFGQADAWWDRAVGAWTS